jgi:hypothetical protein
MKLSSALSCIVFGQSLISILAMKNSLRGGNRDDLSGPFDVLLCTSEGLTDESKCTSARAADGSGCSYCTMTHDGEKTGVCVDPKVASRMVQINDEVSCTKLPQKNTLEMDLDENKIPHRFVPVINMAKCIFKGGQTQDQCFAVDLPQEKHCAFCKVESNGQEGTLCVGPEAVPQLTGSGQNITCSVPDNSLYEDLLYVEEPEEDGEVVTYDMLKSFFDQLPYNNPLSFEMQAKISLEIPFFDSFKCAMKGGQNEDSCSAVELDGDRKCGFCTYESNGQEAKLCVSPEAADKLSETNEAITCTGGQSYPNETDEHEPEDEEAVSRYNKMSAGLTPLAAVSSMPAADCNLKGADRETCLDPSKVNGADCVWCDGGIGGFCFPKSWESAASKLFKCGKDLKLTRDEAELKIA